MTDEQAYAVVAELQEWARSRWGEPQYRYFKQYRWWSSRDRCYMRGLAVDEVMREEYDAEAEKAARLAALVRSGKAKPVDYYEYGEELASAGWREHLAELVQVEAVQP